MSSNKCTTITAS